MKKKFFSLVIAFSALIIISLFMCMQAGAQVITPDVKLNYTSYEYAGKPLGPGLTVTDENGTVLVRDRDYKVKYGEGRVYPGTYTVTIYFIGKYEGTPDVVKNFDITESKVSVKLNYTSYEYAGKPLGPGLTVTDSRGKVLTRYKDYDLLYSEGRIEPGTYNVKITLKGDYIGTVVKYFDITESNVSVKLNYTSYEYAGKPLGPGLTVTDSRGKALTRYKDYDLLYSEGRIDPGTYNVKIILKGNYRGTITKYFDITENKISVKLNYTSYEYAGKPLGPGMTVTDSKGNVLSRYNDYDLLYSDGRIEPGTYSVKITLKGNYKGTEVKYFSITDNKISVKLNYTWYEYTGSPLGPGMTITDSKGETLTYKKDYVVDYGSGRINPGKYTVHIKLQGNYRGSASADFLIGPKGVNSGSVSASAGKESIALTWDKMTTQTSGYQVQYSRYSDFRSPKWIKISNSNSNSCNINNLMIGTKYYIRVRTYKNVNGSDYTSKWSDTLVVRTEGSRLLEVAKGELGNKGGKKYWSWFGYKSRAAWCCIFVAWCGNECGYVDAGIIPKYQAPRDAADWFKERGQWQGRNYIPQPGDLIFFDWNGYGYPHHVGIVEKVEGGYVHTVEGNSKDVCKRLTYSLTSKGIYGYGTPDY